MRCLNDQYQLSISDVLNIFSTKMLDHYSPVLCEEDLKNRYETPIFQRALKQGINAL